MAEQVAEGIVRSATGGQGGPDPEPVSRLDVLRTFVGMSVWGVGTVGYALAVVGAFLVRWGLWTVGLLWLLGIGGGWAW